jgi:nucleoid-associated protein YgaU
MSPIFRHQGDLGQASKDLAASPANVKPDVAAPSHTDIAKAHQFFKPAIDGQALSAAHMANPAMTAAGHEAISPIIQMIMRMPGHIGLFSSFFEALGNFLAPHADLLAQIGIDPTHLFDHAHAATSMLPSPEHASIDPSLLPEHAPILSDLRTDLNSPMSERTLMSSESLQPLRNCTQLQVSGQLDFSKSQFEGLNTRGFATNNPSELLSGPSLSDTNCSVHLSGSQRLMSDTSHLQYALANNNVSTSSTLAASSTPSGSSFTIASSNTLPSSLNVSGNIADGQISAQPAVAQISDGAISSGNASLNLTSISSNDVSTATNSGAEALRSNFTAPSTAADTTSATSYVDSHPQILVALKAKALSLDSFMSKSGTPHSGGSNAPLHHAYTTQPKAPHIIQPHKPAESIKESTKEPIQHSAVQKSTGETSHLKKATHEPSHTTHIAKEKPSISSIAKSSTTYTIRAGDCLWNIAKDQLHAGARWEEIYKLNQNILGSNPAMLHAGTTIQLPGASSHTDIAQAAPYTVKPGDNLWNLSKHFLGDGSKWGQIYQVNHDAIGVNPRMITPGQQLTIPDAHDAGTSVVSKGHVSASADGVGTQPNLTVSENVASPSTTPTIEHQTARALYGPGAADAANLSAGQTSANSPASTPSPVSSNLMTELNSFLKKK